MTISNSLRYIFLIHFLICLVFGVLFFLSPEYIVTATGWPFLDPVTGRVVGAMFLGWAFGSLFGYRATEWSEVKILVIGHHSFAGYRALSFLVGRLLHPVPVRILHAQLEA